MFVASAARTHCVLTRIFALAIVWFAGLGIGAIANRLQYGATGEAP